MTITNIIKKPKHLHEIEFSCRDSILIDSSVCAEQGLYKGMELTNAQIAEIAKKSDYERAFSRSVWYIERGDITKKALTDKLKRAGFSADATEHAVNRLISLDLLNDQAFAARLAERLIESNISRREAFSKMLLKGFCKEDIENALHNTECCEDAQIKAVIEKKYKNKLDTPENIRKVYAALIRRGFSFGGVRAVLKNYSEELMFSEE